MTFLIRNVINKIDSIYHQRKIFKTLKDLNVKVAIDVGAHKGEFLSYLLKLNNIEKIHVFEPQKKIFSELVNKFSNNRKIVLNNFAISNEIGNKIIKINKLTSTSTFSEISERSLWFKLKNIILFSQNSIDDSYQVSTQKLDNYIKEQNITKIDLLKIDTEGHEINVLNGLENTLRRQTIKYILIEINLTKMYKNYNVSEIENFLKEKNYNLINSFKFPILNFEDRLYEKHH